MRVVYCLAASAHRNNCNASASHATAIAKSQSFGTLRDTRITARLAALRCRASELPRDPLPPAITIGVFDNSAPHFSIQIFGLTRGSDRSGYVALTSLPAFFWQFPFHERVSGDASKSGVESICRPIRRSEKTEEHDNDRAFGKQNFYQSPASQIALSKSRDSP